MKERVEIKKESVKDKVIGEFLKCKEEAEAIGLNYFPSGLLSFYLSKGQFSTYPARIIGQYCKDNNIQIKRAGEMGIKEWDGTPTHGNMRIYIFNS